MQVGLRQQQSVAVYCLSAHLHRTSNIFRKVRDDGSLLVRVHAPPKWYERGGFPENLRRFVDKLHRLCSSSSGYDDGAASRLRLKIKSNAFSRA
jgi:hypothetical protein